MELSSPKIEKFLIFREMELFKKLLIFQEGTFWLALAKNFP